MVIKKSYKTLQLRIRRLKYEYLTIPIDKHNLNFS
jgi:hypothetical protein